LVDGGIPLASGKVTKHGGRLFEQTTKHFGRFLREATQGHENNFNEKSAGRRWSSAGVFILWNSLPLAPLGKIKRNNGMRVVKYCV
jgi:hypothetical protein